MEKKKYEFTGEVMEWQGHTLHRIRVLASFARDDAGQVGGWIESEENLSHEGHAWVADNAKVFGKARIFDNAAIYGDAQVSGHAQVFEDARIGGKARVCDSAMIYGQAQVYGRSQVYGFARVCNETYVYDNARVHGNGLVCGNATISGDTEVYGTVMISGNAYIGGDAKVCQNEDYAVFKNCWSSKRWFTYTRSNKMWNVGCFYGTGDALIRKAYADSEMKGRCYEAIVRAMETIEAAMLVNQR